VAVADELNFGRAASRLYVSQPALSRQIRALERLVGCELASRAARLLEPVGDLTPVTIIEQLRRFASAYLDGHPIDDPLVSPLTADLTGLPPLLVQSATGDSVLQEARQLTDRTRAHGVDARLDLYPVATHVFHIFWSFLPEAADALEQAGGFIRELQESADVGAG
jgi:monoterpene epsilon-lactone hydrolase